MFNKNDKVNLTLINARDINGKIIPLNIKLPLSDNRLSLPEEIASIDVFEYHEGFIIGGSIIYSIHIGKISTIENLIDEIRMKKVKILDNVNIKSINSYICYQNIFNKKVVYTNIKEQDIVLEKREHLLEYINDLSNNITILNNAINDIKTLRKKY